MKRRASALLLALAATGMLAACESNSEEGFYEMPLGDQPAEESGQASSSLQTALDQIDCEQPTSASIEASGLVQAGECVPFAGVETIEFYDFESEGAAQAWVDSDAQVGAVDGIYRYGTTVIIDRNNDYLLQLAAQFEPAI